MVWFHNAYRDVAQARLYAKSELLGRAGICWRNRSTGDDEVRHIELFFNKLLLRYSISMLLPPGYMSVEPTSACENEIQPGVHSQG